MRRRYVNYNLEHGFIQNWLVAGPQRIPIEPEKYSGNNFKDQITQEFYNPSSEISKTPVERGPLTKGLFQVGDYAGSWEYYACQEDHLIDFSKVYFTPFYLRSWAYTQLSCKSEQEVLLILTTNGPADLWLNGSHIHRYDHVSEQQPANQAINVKLKKGVNKILLRFEAVVIQKCVYAVALQVCNPSDPPEPFPVRSGIHVTIPTLIEGLSRRNKFEQAAAMTYLTRDVFEPEDQIRLHWADDLAFSSPAVVRLQNLDGKIYAEANVDGTAGDDLFLNFPIQVPAGPHCIFLMPLAWEYYERDMRITRRINFWNMGRQQFSSTPYGSIADRRQEALISATKISDFSTEIRTSLFVEIAKMALNQWESVDIELLLKTMIGIQPRDLLGLLGITYRFSNNERFPESLQGPIEETILGFQYKMLSDRWHTSGSSESDQILLRTLEILAGQRFPQKIFQWSGKSGQWHQNNGEQLVLEWLHQRGAYGFSDWDSNVGFAEQLLVLSYLVDLSESETIREMSAVIMDKLFVTIAINSYQGVFGSTHGRTNALFVKGGLLDPTSGITRLMWGTGVFNHHVAGIVSLACMQNYELPSIISDIAVSKHEEIWDQECHQINKDRVVNKVTYKTPDYMLSSAQDYYPGEKGAAEHIWQATLGRTASVFVTHPACSSEDDARQPNFWAGNVVLPRVAQWKDVLLALYKLPENDWMGFTHAYFPIYAFDEYSLNDGWAFARKGDGYLALKSSRGFSLIRHGNFAYRELRSYGRDNIWLLQMGRQSLDGDFRVFQEKVQAMPVAFTDTSVRCTTLREEVLSFSWEGPFMRNRQEQALSGFEHYANPFVAAEFPCKQMAIRYGEDLLRLNFE